MQSSIYLRERWTLFFCTAFVIILIGVVGCSTPVGVKRVGTKEAHQLITASVLSTGTPSIHSQQVLSCLDLREQFDDDPKAALASLHTILQSTNDPDRINNRLFALDRDWQPDVAELPSAKFDGDRVTIHNIRNNDYRTETDYTVQYYDKAFDLSQLRTADLFISFWGSPSIAHTIMSFGFGGNDYVAISIETRKTKDEEYSALKGFFKQYELISVVSDERDVGRLRTNYRGEDVYLYRLNAQPELVRSVFQDYFTYINHLKDHPEWYNALTHNCTTAIRGHVVPHTITQRWPSWKLLVNGYLDGRLYEIGAVDRSLPFADLKARSRINERAKATDGVADFSRKIRDGLPGMDE